MVHENKEKRQGDVDLGNLFGGPQGRQDGDIDMGNLFGGPQGRQGGDIDMGNLFNEEKRDYMGQMERLTKAVKEAQATIDAGTMEVRMPSKNKKRSGHQYTMCVFCDDMCLDQIAGAGYSTDGYFDAIVADMNTMLSGVDAGSAFSLAFKLIPGSPIYLQWFADRGLTGEELLTAVNDAFWEGTGLYDLANGYGCDVDFMVSSSSDPSWDAMGSVAGIANMMQLCQMSFSVVKMYSNPHTTASLMMHEFGHMIGMYHDGNLDTGYTSLESYFAPGQMLGGCSDEYTALTEQCVAGASGIMSAVIGGNEFSSCSEAYFNMFLCLAEVMPNYYSTACV